MQRFLDSRGMVACLLAMATGMILYFRMPFPEDNVLFELMYLRASPVFWGFKYTYILLLYTTPFIGYSILLSGLYVFASKIQLMKRASFAENGPIVPVALSLCMAISELSAAQIADLKTVAALLQYKKAKYQIWTKLSDGQSSGIITI